MSLRGGTTKQSHTIQGGYASVRLPRFARNDMAELPHFIDLSLTALNSEPFFQPGNVVSLLSLVPTS